MKKIAFCFLCQDDIYHVNIWESFFKYNYEKCNIYIYSENPNNVKTQFCKKYQVSHNNEKTDNTYLKIKFLMKDAVKFNNYKIVIINDSSIPVKSFNYIYDYLTKDNKSYINYIDHIPKCEWQKSAILLQYQKYMYNVHNIPDFIYNIDISNWYYNDKWVIFSLKHARQILYDEKAIKILDKSFAIHENYPLYILSSNDEKKNISNEQNIYINWKDGTRNENGGTDPKIYDIISKGDIKIFSYHKILFLTNVGKNSNINKYIDDILNPKNINFS
tara:strand:- start:120 stop:941 length:822 start_codon:yes stop_codon:yes gene_type:complete